jgi:hypothetical protein
MSGLEAKEVVNLAQAVPSDSLSNCLKERISSLLMVYIRIKLEVDLQADKSSIVVKGPFFPQV